MRVWLDIANTPHVTLFKPIRAELEARGHDVLVTSWDRGQTLQLARLTWPDVTVVGAAGYRRPVVDKGLAIWSRARKLALIVSSWEPEVSFGHNSYSQLVAAKYLRLPSITMMDYEHQPANHLAFRLADKIFLPESLPRSAVERAGATAAKVIHYPGLKEDIALSGFCPDAGFRESLGLAEHAPLVSMRPGAEGALYHRGHNPVFHDLARRLPPMGATVLVSPRTSAQAEMYSALGLRVLTDPVSGPDLLWHSDVVVGGGGTMTREAAVLGTATYTAFAGKAAAVDEQLIREGRLRRMLTAADLSTDVVVRRKRAAEPVDPGAAVRFVDQFLATASTVVGVSSPSGRGRPRTRS